MPKSQLFSNHSIIFSIKFKIYEGSFPSERMEKSELLTRMFKLKRKTRCGEEPRKVCVQNLTVKLLLTFFVLDSATLASVRSTSSNMIDCRDTDTAVSVGLRHPEAAAFLSLGPGQPPTLPDPS